MGKKFVVNVPGCNNAKKYTYIYRYTYIFEYSLPTPLFNPGECIFLPVR